ncbi:thiamine pyrophosphate-binding protein [Variovorax ginsengisoli]|uniref:Thiamine pyrophosphate-binding protein n=1 Tax=Variovorax ginsengisoli TaxID=363844 RepID=A0ABT8SCI9_9BURK|nr:thiamine pyrophosphate-binding protein [Variovorax ginsengisoli]MDN8617469.1 thiamine pyrophosphate-binding protein [Variovorax ginsengisoli]MDO1536639.1 thiamine pyrophosphate-binding protein [Variovorax ginsengisoli]
MNNTLESHSGGDFLARTLKGYGVDHIFFVDAILRHTLAHAEAHGIRRILAHSEKAAAYMADGFSRASRRPSVCMAQSVGAANLAAGLQDAYFAHSPVIALTGRQVANNQYRHAYQELPHEPLFTPVTKFSGRVETPFQLAHLTRHAFRVATSGLPGPVHLDMAGHVGNIADNWQSGEPVVAEPRHRRVPAHRARPEAQALHELAQALQQAQAPVVVVGAALVWSGGEAALRALAQHVQLPVLCTLDAKAAMADLPTLDMGVTGTYGTDGGNRFLSEADFVLFVGCDVGDQVTSNWRLPLPGVATAHVGVDAEDLGRNLPGALTLQADPATALEELRALLPSASREHWIGRGRALKAQWWTQHAPMLDSAAEPVRPERLMRELGRWLPLDGVLVADTGYASQWSGQLLQLKASSQIFLRAAGSLGWGFPASLGAKAASPDRPVVCLTGDGGFMYHLPELETARRWGLRTITVVNNNGCLAQGLSSLRKAQIGGERMHDCYQFIHQDFAEIARSFGCTGLRVTRPSELGAALEQALASELPVVIDVLSDPAALAPVPWMPPA